MSSDKKEISYVISVSVETGCYRHIKISSKATFFDLHAAILDAFEFFDDHAHAFFLDNIAWSDADCLYSDMIEDEERYTSDFQLDQGGLLVGKKFKYIFDFGDEWIFQCKLLKILDETTEHFDIVRSKGDVPVQYASFEYDEESEEDPEEEEEDSDENE